MKQEDIESFVLALCDKDVVGFKFAATVQGALRSVGLDINGGHIVDGSEICEERQKKGRSKFWIGDWVNDCDDDGKAVRVEKVRKGYYELSDGTKLYMVNEDMYHKCPRPAGSVEKVIDVCGVSVPYTDITACSGHEGYALGVKAVCDRLKVLIGTYRDIRDNGLSHGYVPCDSVIGDLQMTIAEVGGDKIEV